MIEMNAPVGQNVLDQQAKTGLVGKPMDRVDGPLRSPAGRSMPPNCLTLARPYTVSLSSPPLATARSLPSTRRRRCSRPA